MARWIGACIHGCTEPSCWNMGDECGCGISEQCPPEPGGHYALRAANKAVEEAGYGRTTD